MHLSWLLRPSRDRRHQHLGSARQRRTWVESPWLTDTSSPEVYSAAGAKPSLAACRPQTLPFFSGQPLRSQLPQERIEFFGESLLDWQTRAIDARRIDLQDVAGTEAFHQIRDF